MPLFGKKKSEKRPAPTGSYPGQGGYPTAAAYPTAQPGAYGAPPAQYGAPPAQYGAAAGAPPPYTPTAQPMGGYPGGYPAGYPAAAGYPAPIPQASYGPPQTVQVAGGFDAGARFNSTATANVPPPPPGCMPNQAQAALSQGHNVVVGQRPDKYFEGGSDGGYTIW